MARLPWWTPRYMSGYSYALQYSQGLPLLHGSRFPRSRIWRSLGSSLRSAQWSLVQSRCTSAPAESSVTGEPPRCRPCLPPASPAARSGGRGPSRSGWWRRSHSSLSCGSAAPARSRRAGLVTRRGVRLASAAWSGLAASRCWCCCHSCLPASRRLCGTRAEVARLRSRHVPVRRLPSCRSVSWCSASSRHLRIAAREACCTAIPWSPGSACTRSRACSRSSTEMPLVTRTAVEAVTRDIAQRGGIVADEVDAGRVKRILALGSDAPGKYTGIVLLLPGRRHGAVQLPPSGSHSVLVLHRHAARLHRMRNRSGQRLGIQLGDTGRTVHARQRTRLLSFGRARGAGRLGDLPRSARVEKALDPSAVDRCGWYAGAFPLPLSVPDHHAAARIP